jgi:sigma-B regulation protein RsbQ
MMAGAMLLDQPELAVELTDSFCRTDPDIAKQFARVTFLSDNRKDVGRLQSPTLIIQSSEDIIAPLVVGEFLHRTLPNGMLRVVDNVGHCPHLSAPSASAQAMNEFLASLALPVRRA